MSRDPVSQLLGIQLRKQDTYIIKFSEVILKTALQLQILRCSSVINEMLQSNENEWTSATLNTKSLEISQKFHYSIHLKTWKKEIWYCLHIRTDGKTVEKARLWLSQRDNHYLQGGKWSDIWSWGAYGELLGTVWQWFSH